MFIIHSHSSHASAPYSPKNYAWLLWTATDFLTATAAHQASSQGCSWLQRRAHLLRAAASDRARRMGDCAWPFAGPRGWNLEGWKDTLLRTRCCCKTSTMHVYHARSMRQLQACSKWSSNRNASLRMRRVCMPYSVPSSTHRCTFVCARADARLSVHVWMHVCVSTCDMQYPWDVCTPQ